MPHYVFGLSKRELKLKLKVLDRRGTSSLNKRRIRWELAGGRDRFREYCEQDGSCLACRCLADPGEDFCEHHRTIWGPERRLYEMRILTGICVVCGTRQSRFDLKQGHYNVRYYDGTVMKSDERAEYVVEYVTCNERECQEAYDKTIDAYFRHLYKRTIKDQYIPYETFLESGSEELAASGHRTSWSERQRYRFNIYGLPGSWLYPGEKSRYEEPKFQKPAKRCCIIKYCRGTPLPGGVACRRHERRIIACHKKEDRCLLRRCRREAAYPGEYPFCLEHHSLLNPATPWPAEYYDEHGNPRTRKNWWTQS